MSLLLTALAATPTPSPSASASGLPRQLDPNDVTPGVVGFLATAAVVVVSILLIVNLVHRMRRIRHRAAVEEAAERARADALRERSLDPAGAEQDDGRGGGALSSGHDVVRGEFRDRGGAGGPAERDEPGTSGAPRT